MASGVMLVRYEAHPITHSLTAQLYDVPKKGVRKTGPSAPRWNEVSKISFGSHQASTRTKNVHPIPYRGYTLQSARIDKPGGYTAVGF